MKTHCINTRNRQYLAQGNWRKQARSNHEALLKLKRITLSRIYTKIQLCRQMAKKPTSSNWSDMIWVTHTDTTSVHAAFVLSVTHIDTLGPILQCNRLILRLSTKTHTCKMKWLFSQQKIRCCSCLCCPPRSGSRPNTKLSRSCCDSGSPARVGARRSTGTTRHK